MDVWENTTGSDGGVSHESSEFFVVSDSELDVSWDDSASSVVSGGITSEFENFSSEVFKNSSEVDWGSSTNSFGVSSLSEMSVNSTNWELKSSSGSS